MLFFLQHPGVVVTRDTAIPALPQWRSKRALDGYVQKINKKLGKRRLTSEPKLIRSVRGLGYKLDTEVRIKYPADSQEAVELLKALTSISELTTAGGSS